MAAGQILGFEDEGGEESSSLVVGQLQENGPSLVRGAPFVEVAAQLAGRGVWIFGFDKGRITGEIARIAP